MNWSIQADKLKRIFAMSICGLLVVILSPACLSQRQVSTKAPTTSSRILLQEIPSGFSCNGIQAGQALEKVQSLTRARDLELIVESEIARIRNPDTGNFILSMTVSKGYITGLYSDKESGLFVDKHFIFSENSPASLLKALDPELKQLNGKHVFEKEGCRLEVFCKADKVEDFRLVQLSQREE